MKSQLSRPPRARGGENWNPPKAPRLAQVPLPPLGQCSNNSCRKKGPLSKLCLLHPRSRKSSLGGKAEISFCNFFATSLSAGKGRRKLSHGLLARPPSSLLLLAANGACEARHATRRRVKGQGGGAEAAANPRDRKTDFDQQAVSPTTPVPLAAHRHKPEDSKFRLSWRK